MTTETPIINFDPVERMARKDIRAAVSAMDEKAIRYFVDLYYQVQEFRKAAANQARSSVDEPTGLAVYTAQSFENVEATIKTAMDEWTKARTVGRWLQSICGIGPVLAAGLMAHLAIELPRKETGVIEPVQSVGQWWSFAGLDPARKWEKKTKRPWNAKLKTLCWLCGESFVKVSGNDKDVYGKFYVSRKAMEAERNERLEYKDQAATILTEKKIGKDTEAYGHYSAGKLPPAQIHARAKRYAVKLFLSHLHYVMYLDRFGVVPPDPYVIARLGHVDFITPPNLEVLRKNAA